MRETEASNYQQEQQKELLRKKKKATFCPPPNRKLLWSFYAPALSRRLRKGKKAVLLWMNISNIPKYKFYLSTWLSRRKLWSQSFAASLEHHNYPSYRTAERATLCVCPLMPCLSTAHPAMSTGSYCIKVAMMRLKKEASENAWVEHY